MANRKAAVKSLCVAFGGVSLDSLADFQGSAGHSCSIFAVIPVYNSSSNPDLPGDISMQTSVLQIDLFWFIFLA